MDKGFTNIEAVARGVQVKLQYFHASSRTYFKSLALSGLELINETHNPYNVDVVYKTVDSLGEVDFPDDMEDIYKVGINLNGQFWTLTVNKNLLPNRREECNQTIKELGSGHPQHFGGYEYAPHYSSGDYIPSLVSYGAGVNEGYYNFDYKRRKIFFRDVPEGTLIVIEYQTNSKKSGGSTIIHKSLKWPLECFVLWQRIEHREDISLSEKERKRMEFTTALERAEEIQNSFTKDEYLDFSYITTG